MSPPALCRLERIPLDAILRSLVQVRMVRPVVEERLQRSLVKHGQISPVTVWESAQGYELVDGFKRWRAASRIPGFGPLQAKVVEGMASTAKASILVLNQPSGGLISLEEGWLVQSLTREEHLSQAQIASLVGRDQSWVSRRLSLVQRLIDLAQEEVRLGLLAPTIARVLASMPRGIQEKVLVVIRREGLASRQVEALAQLLGMAGPERQEYVLEHARDAIEQQMTATADPPRDPRLGAVGHDLDRDFRILMAVAHRLAAKLTRIDLTQMGPGEVAVLQHDMGLLTRELPELIRVVEWVRTPGRPLLSPAATRQTVEQSSPVVLSSRTS